MKQSTKPSFVYPPVAALALYASVVGSMIPAIRGAFPGLTLAAAGLFSTLHSVGTALSEMRPVSNSLLCISGLGLIVIALSSHFKTHVSQDAA